MTTDAIQVLVLLIVETVLFVTEAMPLAFTALIVPIYLQVFGILSQEQAWSGYINPLVLTLGSLFILGSVFSKSSLIHKVRVKVVEYSLHGSKFNIFLILMFFTVALSILLSSTTSVAICSPIILQICSSMEMDGKRTIKAAADLGTFASRSTLPIGSSLAYLALANTYLEQGGALERIGMMDFSYIKIPMLLVLFGWCVFQNRDFFRAKQSESALNMRRQQLLQMKAEKATEYTKVQDILAQAFFVATVVLMFLVESTGCLPSYMVSVFFCILCVLFRLISDKEAFSAISWSSIFLVAGTLPLSTAINVSGLSMHISDAFEALFCWVDSAFLLPMFFCLVSCLFTQFVSNTAVIAIMSPIAVTIALNGMGDPRLMVIAVFFGANTAFLTPMATTSQAFIYDYCGFRMKEFTKLSWFPCLLMVGCFAVFGSMIFSFLY